MGKTPALLVALLTFMVFVGCAEEKKSRGTAQTRGQRGGGGGSGTSTVAANCEGNAWGVIGPLNSSVTQTQWDTAVKDFANSSVEISQVGFVSIDPNDPKTGIAFCGHFCASNPAQSEIYIGIWDDRSAAEGEISIEVRPGLNGGTISQMNGSPIFSDKFGVIALEGKATTNRNTVTGTVRYQNKIRITNGQEVPAGNQTPSTLGTFEIRPEYFWRCK